MNRSDSVTKDKILKKLDRKFSAFRDSGGFRYTPGLKKMAAEAVGFGLSASSVARAAGTSPSMVESWIAETSAPKAKQLNLIESPAARPVVLDVTERSTLARIRLTSGVEISLSLIALNDELLGKLNSLGGR